MYQIGNYSLLNYGTGTTSSCDTMQQALDLCSAKIQDLIEADLKAFNKITFATRATMYDIRIIKDNINQRFVIDPTNLVLNQYSAWWLLYNNVRMGCKQWLDLIVLPFGKSLIDYMIGVQLIDYVMRIALHYLIEKTDDFDLRLFTLNNLFYSVNRHIYQKHHTRNPASNHSWLENVTKLASDYDFKTLLPDLQQFRYAVMHPKSEEQALYGFKAFEIQSNGELYCRNYNFTVGNTHYKDKYVFPCDRGFHFCLDITQITHYYDISKDNVVVYKVKAWGVVITSGNKSVCNHLQLLEPVDKEEYWHVI